MARARWNGLILILLAAGIAWILVNRVPATGAPGDGLPAAPAVGHPAPDFSLTTLSGETFRLSALQGTPVVLNFWATWCPPCRAEVQELESASGRLKGQVVIAGVDQAETAQQVRDFANKFSLTYPMPLDTDATVSRQYSVRSLPTTFFIDRAGYIRRIQIGAVTEATLTQFLQDIYP